jgi:protein gp37
MAKSKILWTHRTWNPVLGCRKASAGCNRCYALSMARRLAGGLGDAKTTAAYRKVLNKAGEWNGEAVLMLDRLGDPLRWRKAGRCFPCSMSDLFLDTVPNKYRAAIFGVMALADKQTFQVLTKRPAAIARFYRWLNNPRRDVDGSRAAWTKGGKMSRSLGVCLTQYGRYNEGRVSSPKLQSERDAIAWPLVNAWMGTTIENETTRYRLDDLLAIDAPVRFLSCEPLIGPLDFGDDLAAIDLVIVGGESGPGARAMATPWARSIRDQVLAVEAVDYVLSTRSPVNLARRRPALMFKQWGNKQPLDQVKDDGVAVGRRVVEVHGERFAILPKTEAGRRLDGRTWEEMPDDVDQVAV